MALTYFKRTADLSKRELLSIYDSFDEKEYPVHYPITDKKSVVLNILRLNPDFFENDPKFIFRINDTGAIEYLKDSTDDCENQRFSRSHHKINLEKILSLAEARSMEEIIANESDFDTEIETESDSDSDSSADSEDSANVTVKPKTPRPQRQHIKKEKPETKPKAEQKHRPGPKPSTRDTRKSSRRTGETTIPAQQFSSSKARVKTPKYDSSLPISAWLRNMEIYGRVTTLSDEELITCALSALLAEEQGSHIISSLTDAELQEWCSFKAKLEDVLGFSRDHWKHLYENYQRGSDSFGVAMAKLTSYYRQGYNIKELRAHDNELLVEKFCAAQDDRLRELLLRDKANLDVSSIVKRANELERSIPKREVNFATIASQPETETMAKQIQKLMEEFSKLKTDLEAKKSKANGKKKSKIDLDKAQGYCIKYTNTGSCKFGSDCKYLHSKDAPKSVLDYAKSLL